MSKKRVIAQSLVLLFLVLLVVNIVIAESFSREFTDIKKGEVRTMILEDSPVYEVKLTFNKYLDSASLEVQTFTEHPNGIKELEQKSESERVYKYLNFKEEGFTSQDLSSFEFKITVSKEWLAKYKIDTSSLKIYKYSSGVWKEESYFLEGEDNDSYFYKVSSQPYLFLVTGEDNSIPPVKPETRESIVVGASVSDSKEGNGKGYTWLLVVLVIAAIICLVFIFSGKKEVSHEAKEENTNPLVSEMRRSGMNVSEDELKRNQDQLRRELRL